MRAPGTKQRTFAAICPSHARAPTPNRHIQILDAALADGLVSANVAKLVKPPTPPRRRDVHLSDDDVRKVIEATPIEYRALVITLVGLGLPLCTRAAVE